MGLADMLIQLGIKYGSPESIKIVDEIYKTIATTAVEESLALAKSLGCYPKCNKAKLIYSSFIRNLNLPASTLGEIADFGLYNSQLLTCAPTGSIGTMFETSTGVEPHFALSYTRKTQSLNGEDTYYQVDSKIVEDYKEITGDIKLPNYFVTSANINPIDRIKVQAALQKYTDASISSTINLPNETTVDEIYNIYIEAWKNKLKGVTIYRSGCKREGILTTDKPESKGIQLEAIHDELSRGYIVKAGDNCIGLKRTLTTGCGTLHVTAYFDPNNGELRETYLSKGSTGGCQNFMVGLSRMISLAARGGLPLEAILDQLKSCGTCPSYAVRRATKKDTSVGSCCPVAVSNALKDMYNEMQDRIKNCKPIDYEENHGITTQAVFVTEYSKCPECHGDTLVHEGGCTQCLSCGYSKCE